MMRPADQIHAQIQWDDRLDASGFSIGIDVHRATEKVIPFSVFQPNGDIPWHRVRWFAFNDRRVWDRGNGTDTVTELAASEVAAPWRLKGAWQDRSVVRFDGSAWVFERSMDGIRPEILSVVSYNVLWDRFLSESIDSAERWPRLIDTVLALGAHVVAFQEVDPAFARLLHQHPVIRDRYWLTHGPMDPAIGTYDLLVMGRVAVDQAGFLTFGPHKGGLAVVVGSGDDRVAIVTTHLSSDHRANASARRASEIARLTSHLPGRIPWVVVGDLNVRSEQEPTVDGVDAWLALHPEPSPTYDPSNNPLAKVCSKSGRSGRLDRVICGPGARPTRIERLGVGQGLSDHYGLLVDLELATESGQPMRPTTVHSALCWILEGHDEVDALRAERDPAYARWPAHLNVLWGFAHPSESDVLWEIAEVCAKHEPFSMQFGRVSTWGTGPRSVHHLAVDDATRWTALRHALSEACRVPYDSDQEPHVTVARGGPAPSVSPCAVRVEQLVWLTRQGDKPFVRRASIALGSGEVTLAEQQPIRMEEALPFEHPLLNRPEFDLVGSRRAGAALKGADVDGVVDGASPAEVGEWLMDAGAVEIRQVEKNGLSGFHATLDGLSVDVVVASTEEPSRSRALSAIADADWVARLCALPERRILLLQVKLWARHRGLDDPAFGGLEGLAWAVMVSEIATKDLTLRSFFEVWASHDWREGVSIRTPTEPIRVITERSDAARLEARLLEAWQQIESGQSVFLPELPMEQTRWLLVIRWSDEAQRGRVRARGPLWRDALAGRSLVKVNQGIGYGFDEPEVAFLVVVEAALTGVGAVVQFLPSEQVALARHHP